MTRKRTTLLAPALAVPMIALVIAGCGGGSGNANASPSMATTKQSTSAGGGAAMVSVRSTGLGKILTDSQGRTLYLFQKDTGSKSTCSGACASEWPPFPTTGKPKAGSGASTSLLGTTTRSDGSHQVTYNGHPLYYFSGDQKPGDMNGQGLTEFGALWYVVSPAGKQITSASTSTSSGGY